ncbi:MAG: peptidase M23 [Gammaproteobacteria bacterium]|nr:MAG: peptidase M23 [Gammaproteobacteria bacterium]RLA21907.1 MAG: peptidase M23 [Gammaproteobacteria bacterium]
MKHGVLFCRFLLVLLLCLQVSFSHAEALSKEAKSKQQALRQVQKKIQVIQKSLGILEKEEGSLSAQLKIVERRYGKVAGAIRDLNRQVLKQDRRLKSVQKERDSQKELVKLQSSALEKQIVSAYAIGKDEKLKLLLNSEDPARNSRLLVYYDYLNRARLQRLQEIQKGLSELRQIEKKHLIESERLGQLLSQKKREQKRLDSTRQERKLILVSLKKELGSQDRQLQQLKEDEGQLQKLIASLHEAMEQFPVEIAQNKPFAKQKGKLAWPLKGRISQRFGSKRESGRWSGMLLAAKEGVDVRTIAGGRVAYADWLRGYGLLTIIDHGDGYMSLYAFSQSLYREVGDWVGAGERIASVGYSGGRTKPALYFEIRKKGKPVNPVKWCRKAKKGRVG